MRLPQRAVAIILKEDEILLMERRNEGKHYFVFPGGGVESGETIKEAVLREVAEETTLEIEIKKKLNTHYYTGPMGKSSQHLYLCSYVSGIPRLGDANEKKSMDENNFYKPQWVKLGEIPNLLFYTHLRYGIG